MNWRNITNDELIDLYINKDLSSIKIAKMYDVCVSSVCRKINKLGIMKPPTGHEGRNGKRGKVYIKGYPVVYMPNHPRAKNSGYVREHILVVEKMIGRTPTKEESIHHIDLDKSNNSKSNLLLFKNHKEHMKLHSQLTEVLHSIGLKRNDGRKAIASGLIVFSDGVYKVLERTSTENHETQPQMNVTQ